MGEESIRGAARDDERHPFIRRLLDDIRALQYMLDHDWFETGITRMGAEQEMALVYRDSLKPACVAMPALERMAEHPWLTSELAAFNLEINLSPQELTAACFTRTEEELLDRLGILREQLHALGTDYVLTGILPTLRKDDLDMRNLTPKERYHILMEALKEMQLGQAFELRLTGIDELLVRHDSPLLEACNTSFQVHLQVEPRDFVRMYNIAQALAAPVLAMAANSPMVFGRRLWHETRIALFQQSIDTRSTHDHMRERSARVQFGSGWLRGSILDIYKEDIARFRVLIGGTTEEDSLDKVRRGEVPHLRALQAHNSTIYRWNRPCYGVGPDGRPHLRIENRVLPSGPTVRDEVANAAFWLGAMLGMGKQVEDITERVSWEDVRDNFGKVARFGIDTQLNWFDDRKIGAVALVRDVLLPLAEEGLRGAGVRESDIRTYLGVIEERCAQHMNGARWILRAFTKLKRETGQDVALYALTATIMENQHGERPGHTWDLPGKESLRGYMPSSMKVEEIMSTDLFTAHTGDAIALVTEIMDWRRIRYMPVEDEKGALVGLVTSRLLLQHYAKDYSLEDWVPATVGDIMIREPITIAQDAPLLDALRLMREHRIGCLPVLQGNDLAGIVTEEDFMRVASLVLEREAERE